MQLSSSTENYEEGSPFTLLVHTEIRLKKTRGSEGERGRGKGEGLLRLKAKAGEQQRTSLSPLAFSRCEKVEQKLVSRN